VVQDEGIMSDEASVQVSIDPGHDALPLLPRGDVLFEEIPVRAVVLDALAPTLGHGCLVVRDRDRGAVVLVRDGVLLEVHAFNGGSVRSGDDVLAEVQAWSHAMVSAHRLDPVLVDVCEALVSGEVVYTDLRLDWVEWPLLLADLGRRGGTYAVEIFTPGGRGVTCVAGGDQILSYTDIHPSLGDPALLEAMASNRDGSMRVRRLATAAFAPAAARPRGGSEELVPEPSPAAHAAPQGADTDGPAHGTPEPAVAAEREAADVVPPVPAAREERALPVADEVLPDLTWVAPWQTPWREDVLGAEAIGSGVAVPSSQVARPSVGDMLAGLRSIAQRRLQLSASRVEIILDEAAREQRPLDSVLEEIRAMSIRGVMPSTVDAMVAEMKIAAAEYRSN
jgi:hypothetical protein